MRFHHRSLTIIASPIAAWALFACLTLIGVGSDVSGIGAVVWGVLWIGVAWVRVRSGGLSGSLRGGAIGATLLVPVPVFLLTELVDILASIPASVAVPMFSVLCSAAPLLLWTLTLRQKQGRRRSEPMLVIPWHQYDPHAPAGAIPPRTT